MELWFGAVRVTLDRSGVGSLQLAESEDLNGHVGYMSVRDGSGAVLGEIEVIPSKLSQAAYEALRADLVRVWGDLIFDPNGVTALSARPPSAAELLARIERPLLQILNQPAERLVTATGIRRFDRVRHPREMRPALVFAGRRGAPALTRVLERSTDTAERQLVVATLHRLLQHARRDPKGGSTTRRIERLLSRSLAGVQVMPLRSLTWGMRSDPRYRQVLAVYRILDQPYLHATEGPGELRLGVRGMVRLYEYWVYLQVLLTARALYGAPLDPGFDVLAVEQRRGHARRLELSAGTTVSFPGDVHIAFEPEIRSNGSGWMNIEYVPHPDQHRQQFKATPDVAVFCGGDHPRLNVIDAKYVGRAYVEQRAAELHEKYARMRLRGRPIVDAVYAAHPHAHMDVAWAGYGHFGLAPGHGAVIPLPPVGRRTGDVRTPQLVELGEPISSRTEYVTIVADQFWMLRHLGGRRIRLDDLRKVVANGRPVHKAFIVMPDLVNLYGFAAAAEREGWEVRWASDVDREVQLDDLADLVDERIDDGRVIVVSGDEELVERLPNYLVEVCSDLSAVPDMAARDGHRDISGAGGHGVATDGLIDRVRELVAGLGGPTLLAELAEVVMRELGPEVAENWGGFKKFKELVVAACPDVEIDNSGPGYVLPRAGPRRRCPDP